MEICGSDGRCYCPDGTLVVPLIDSDGTLIGHNQTCPISTTTARSIPNVIMFLFLAMTAPPGHDQRIIVTIIVSQSP